MHDGGAPPADEMADLVAAVMSSPKRRADVAVLMTINGEPELAQFIQRPDISEFVKTFVEVTIGDGVDASEIESGVAELHRVMTARSTRLRRANDARNGARRGNRLASRR
jgi:hypothetical protein